LSQPQIGSTYKFRSKRTIGPFSDLLQKGPLAGEIEQQESPQFLLTTLFLNVVSGLPVPPRKSWSGVSTSLVLPRTLPPSIPVSISPLVEQNYTLKIFAYTEG